MAIVLHRFGLSHYCEKVRAVLDFKGLDYRIEEHVPGPGQVAILRLSGQRKVPVIEHDGKVVHDSTAIALYLESTFPDARRTLPEDPAKRDKVLALEEALDRDFGEHAPLVWARRALRDDRMVGMMGQVYAPYAPPTLVAALARVARTAEGLSKVSARYVRAETRVRSRLVDLSRTLASSPYVLGAEPTLADITAATLPHHLKFPRSRYLAAPELAGQGTPGVADDPTYAPFFNWRDAFYERFLK
jgi:glutathione S-transferase